MKIFRFMSKVRSRESSTVYYFNFKTNKVMVAHIFIDHFWFWSSMKTPRCMHLYTTVHTVQYVENESSLTNLSLR